MTQNTEEDIGNWCQCLTSREVDEHLRTLEMRASGSKFAKMNRLSQWLLGVYDPEDFQSEEGQSERSLWLKGENLAAGNNMLHNTPQSSGNETNLTSVADHTTLPQFTEPMVPMTSSAGTKFTVPEAFLEFCVQLMRENKTLSATSNIQGTASSTKVNEDKARNIRLQDMYTCQYPVNSTHDAQCGKTKEK